MSEATSRNLKAPRANSAQRIRDHLAVNPDAPDDALAECRLGDLRALAAASESVSPELDRLRDFQRKVEEDEAACCPEDVGFVEWIGILTKRLEEAKAALLDVLKMAEVNETGAMIDNDKRPTEYKEGLVKAFGDVAKYIRAKLTTADAIERARNPS